MNVQVVVFNKLGLNQLPAHGLLGFGPLGFHFGSIQRLIARAGHPLFEKLGGQLKLSLHQLVGRGVKKVLLGIAQVDLRQLLSDLVP